MAKGDRYVELYVRGYRKSATRDDLKALFSRFGRIVDVQYKGAYSFIEFAHYKDAEAAVKSMNFKIIDGVELTVQPSGKNTSSHWTLTKRSKSLSPKKKRHRRDNTKKRRSKRSESPSSSSSSSSRSSSSSSSSDSKSSSRSHNRRRKAIHKDKKYHKK